MRRSERAEAFSEYVAARRGQLARTAYLLCNGSTTPVRHLPVTKADVYRLVQDGRLDLPHR